VVSLLLDRDWDEIGRSVSFNPRGLGMGFDEWKERRRKDREQESKQWEKRQQLILADREEEDRKQLIEMKRRVREAKKIIGPGPKCDIERIQKSVAAMMVRQYRREYAAEFAIGPTNKLQKVALSKLARSLQDLNAALKNANLPRYYLRFFEPEQKRKELEKEIEKLASSALKPPKRSSRLQSYAVALAADLLDRHNLPRPITREGKFCKLAAALYGKNSPDMFNHCRKNQDVDRTTED
jgi:hypothetical protein